MTDIKQWIEQVEHVSPPDQWTDISTRGPSTQPLDVASPFGPRRGHRKAPGPCRRVAVIVAAFALTIAATGALIRVFRSDRHEGPSQPFPSPMANGDIWASVGTSEGGITIERVDPVTGASSILWSDGRDPSTPDSKAKRVAVGSDYSFSPDGSQVVFSAGSTTPDSIAIELFIMNADGTDVRQVTHDEGIDVFPAWSPDGGSIAYIDNRAARNHCLILQCSASHLDVVDLVKGIATQLIDTPVGVATPSWSPDGTQLAFVSLAADGREQLEVMDADGTNPTKIDTAPDSSVLSPSWSPDGQRILFLRQTQGETLHLWTIAPDGSDARDLLDTGADTNFGRPVWSPDGTMIAYARVVENQPQVWLVEREGTGDHRLAAVPHQEIVPIAWQPVRRGSVVQETIVIAEGRPNLGERITLAPPPSGSEAQAMTSAEALAAFKKVDPQYTAADDATAWLGLYTSFRFKDRLAWGYLSIRGCPPPSVPVGYSVGPAGMCSNWLFLDATTGEMLEAMFQPVASASPSP